MTKLDVAGLKVDALSKTELLERISGRLKAGQKTWLTTLYSEFLYTALRDRDVLEMLNKADLAVADGIGIIWAAKFLRLRLWSKNYWLTIAEALAQIFYSGMMILFRPKWIKSVIPEKIVGADLIWDLARLATVNGWTVYLLGGFGDTPGKAALALSVKFPSLKIAGYSAKNPDDLTLCEDIKKASPDLLLVAYGPIRQEAWIAKNLPNLPVKLAVGLGGTFDYLAGNKPNPPRFMRYRGLEWLFRLFTQPGRIKRIYRAVFGLASSLVKYKVFNNLPYRQNAVCVVLNKKNEVFIARFNPEKEVIKILGHPKELFSNFWQLPQGGINDGEEAAEGAKRELWEETAMRHIELIKLSDKTYSYVWKDFGCRALLVAKRYRYKGQEQKIVYFRFTGPEKEVVLDWDEFVEYKWVPWQDLEKEVHPEKLAVAKIVLSDLHAILR